MANMDKKEKMYEAIKYSLQPEIAMALVESSGAGSVDEIRFLVGLVCEFKKIAFHSNVNGSKGIILSAQYAEDDAYKNYYLKFSFQYKVKNAAPKSPDWRVDMAVFVYANYPIEEQEIGRIAFEYDGHPSHYLQENIKKQMLRDAHILEQEIMPVQRVSPEKAKSDPGLYKKALRKYLRRCIDIHKKTVEATTSKQTASVQGYSAKQPVSPSGNIDRFVDRPACQTPGGFEPLCKEHVRLRKCETMHSDMLDFFTVPCLACCTGTAKTKCRHCGGTRTMDNIKALEYAKNHVTFESRWK